MIQKKICMLGAFAVGKTSLVSRFVHSIFSDKYHTTVGVKIDKKQLDLDGGALTLLIWDLAGEDELMKIRSSYLRGAAGHLLVVDGTRRQTLDTALELHQRVHQDFGALPFVLMLNKADLTDQWQLDDDRLGRLLPQDLPVLRSSAKTGAGVEEAMHLLARQMVKGHHG